MTLAGDDVIELEFERAPWTQIPVELINDAEISVQARFLYVKLRSYENQPGTGAFPRQRTLAQALGCSPRSVRRYVAELVERGWLRVKQQRRSDGSRTVNRYLVAASARRTSRIPEKSNDTESNAGIPAGVDQRSSVSAGDDQRQHGTPYVNGKDVEKGISAGGNKRSPVSGGMATRVQGYGHQCPDIELEPLELQPPTNQGPTHQRRLVVVDSDDDGVSEGVTAEARSLARAVRAALPEQVGREIASSALARRCVPLAAAGVTVQALEDATRDRSWVNAGPGAVMAWLASDVLDELEAAASAAASANKERTFQRWLSDQPECGHGVAGGDVPRPGSGTPSCPLCRQVAAGSG